MKKFVVEQMKEYEEWLESGDMSQIVDAMVDIIAESYQAFGECEELDEIFKGIEWIDDDGDAIFENWLNYRQMVAEG